MKNVLLFCAALAVLLMSLGTAGAAVLYSEDFSGVTDFTDSWITNAPPQGAGWLQGTSSTPQGDVKVTEDTPFGNAAIDGSTAKYASFMFNLVYTPLSALTADRVYTLDFQAYGIHGRTDVNGIGFYFNNTDWHGEWAIMLLTETTSQGLAWRFDHRLVTGYDDYFYYGGSEEIVDGKIVVDGENDEIWAAITDSAGYHESIRFPVPNDTELRITGISVLQMIRAGDYDYGLDIDNIVFSDNSVDPIPEPGSLLALAGFGMGTLGMLYRRRK